MNLKRQSDQKAGIPLFLIGLLIATAAYALPSTISDFAIVIGFALLFLGLFVWL